MNLAKFEAMDMTSASDWRTHTITAEEFDAGVWNGKGIYRAVCGRDVVAASLVVGPGARCPHCPPLPDTHDPERLSDRLRVALATLPGFAALRSSGTPAHVSGEVV